MPWGRLSPSSALLCRRRPGDSHHTQTAGDSNNMVSGKPGVELDPWLWEGEQQGPTQQAPGPSTRADQTPAQGALRACIQPQAPHRHPRDTRLQHTAAHTTEAPYGGRRGCCQERRTPPGAALPCLRDAPSSGRGKVRKVGAARSPSAGGDGSHARTRTRTQRSARVLMERSFTRPIFFKLVLPLGPGEEDKGF